MKGSRIMRGVAGKLAGLALTVVFCTFAQAKPAETATRALEARFPTIQIGAETYSNVTVTTRAKDYIFIVHSMGMMSVKVADLPPELQEKLGYAVAKPKGQPRAASMGTNILEAMSAETVKMPGGRAIAEQLRRACLGAGPRILPLQGPMGLVFVFGFLVFLLLLYLFYCYCCILICRKAGSEPGVLIWLPLLQMIPLLKAARMSPWWLLVLLVPGPSLVAGVVWAFKIAQARGKGVVTGLLLLLPFTAPFAFLYLAFSGAASQKEEPARVQGMVLETT